MEDVRREERCEYLFLDIEWNQAPGTVGIGGREPVQIAAVAADGELQIIKTFSKAIRLSNPALLNEKTMKVSHMSTLNVMQGLLEEIVLMNFFKSFPIYPCIVVWTRDTYDLLRHDMKKYKMTVKSHQVVILQDVIGVITGRMNGKIGFKKALECVGVEYEPNYLHYAKHDAAYLHQLFRSMYRQYGEMTDEEYCIANLETGKLHTEGCQYIRRMQQGKMMLKPKTVVFQGFVPCKVCGDNQTWKRLNIEFKRKQKSCGRRKNRLKSLPLTDENIEAICRHFRVVYSISDHVVFVRTSIAGWIIYLDGDRVTKLFHENYRMNNSVYSKKQKLKCTEGYHKQKLPSENFYDVISYIKSHDSGIVRKISKKSRLEKLFEKVEMEMQMNIIEN